jgi:hypothetical protein
MEQTKNDLLECLKNINEIDEIFDKYEEAGYFTKKDGIYYYVDETPEVLKKFLDRQNNIANLFDDNKNVDDEVPTDEENEKMKEKMRKKRNSSSFYY